MISREKKQSPQVGKRELKSGTYKQGHIIVREWVLKDETAEEDRPEEEGI